MHGSVPAIDPLPPRVGGPLPFVRGGVGFLRNPTAFLSAARREHGDTFVLDAFGFRLLLTFSPIGLRSLYAAPEQQASFTAATRTLIGFKVPDELLGGDMLLFRKLFARETMAGHLANIHAAVHEDLDALGSSGELELFDRAKQLVHRIGFRAWIGEAALEPARFAKLRAAFERLDPEAAFVRPHTIFWTLLTRKAPERRALREVEAVLREIWATEAGEPAGLLAQLHERHADRPQAERLRAIAGEIMILQLASLTNLYAAIAWTLVHLLLRPDALAAARREAERLESLGVSLESIATLETIDACAHESIRVAQRSITLRKIVAPCEFDDGKQVYRLQPGVMLATMLSVTNGEYGTLDHFDLAHYRRGRLAPELELPTREVVSTFGHGAHACPGQRFAIAAIKLAVAGYLTRFELEPRFASAAPPPPQLGAVARAAQPCRVRYRAR